jgi:hypothetical protein
MTAEQLIAARKAMRSYPTLKVEKKGRGDVVRLTPYVTAKPTQRGQFVDVSTATSPDQLQRDIALSCRNLQHEARV